MSKKLDLQFDNVEEFLSKNPAFAVQRPTPNYAAIRAVLRAGQALDGVRMVEISSEKKKASKESYRGFVTYK